MKPIYTCGYSGHTLDELEQAALALDALILDIRFSPRSRMPEWNQSALQKRFGARYFQFRALGNANYGGNRPIEIQDLPTGLRMVRDLARTRALILFCGCLHPSGCHRTVVAAALREIGLQSEELAWPTVAVAVAGRVRALSLHQPWATLIAIGAKRIETRHWQTSHRGPLVIHAAKTTAGLNDLIVTASDGRSGLQEPFGRTLKNAGFQKIGDLPRGALVCVADLMDCVPTEQLTPTEPETSFGDFTPGRFGWVLDNIRPLPEPVPYRGGQGIFTVEAALLDSVTSLPQAELEHHCHARGCSVKTNPKMLFCGRHWKLTPTDLQREIWRLYRPGQETDKKPTREYLAAMRRAIEAVAAREKEPREVAQNELF